MKKFFFFAVVAACSMAFTSCSDSDGDGGCTCTSTILGIETSSTYSASEMAIYGSDSCSELEDAINGLTSTVYTVSCK